MIKLTYIKSQARVRCELKKRDCLASEDPPIDLLRRARSKMEAEVAAGRLAFFEVYEERLATLWEYLRTGWEDPETTLAVTLAAGAPLLPGLILRKSILPFTLCSLTIEASAEELYEWRFYFLTMTIQKYLKDQGITGVISTSNVHNAFLRACDGEKIVNYRVKTMPKLLPHRHAYTFKSDWFTKAVSLRVYDINAITPPVWQQILDEYHQVVKRCSSRFGGHYKILLRYVESRMRSARRGVERFHLDMPIDILAAYVSKNQVNTGHHSHEARRGSSGSPQTFGAAPVAVSPILEAMSEYIIIESEDDIPPPQSNRKDA